MKNTYFSVKPGAKGSEFYGGGNSQGLNDQGTKYQVPTGKGLSDGTRDGLVGTTSVEYPGNHPVITLLSPRNHPLLGSGGQVVTDRGEVLADRRDVVAMMRQKCMMWKYVACMLMVLVLGIGQMWGADVFSAVPIAGSNLSAKNLTTFTAFTSSQATISGGTLSYKQEDSSDKGIINTSIGPTGDKRICFRIETNKCVYKMVLSGALQNGDVIAADLYNNNVELWFSTSESRPGSAPSTKLASGGTSSKWNAKSYTVTTGDGICGQTTIYIHRNSNTTHFSYLTITRAAGGGCSAPTSPSITGTTEYTAGQDISLTASATGTSASTTYTWYKGANWASASATTPVQAASTSGATFTKASCVVGDAGTYWCNISNGTGCEVQVSQAITVSSAAAPSGPSTSADTPGAEGEITFEGWADLETEQNYWKDGIKFWPYAWLDDDIIQMATNHFTTDVPVHGYQKNITAGSGWGSYTMSGLTTFGFFAMGISVTSPSVVEVIVDNNQNNDLTLANLFIKKDDVSYGTGYGSGNYTSGTDIKSRATITRVTDNTGRYKISIPVSASDLATTSPYIIKLSAATWSDPCAFVFESVTVKPVYTVTYNANGKDGGGAAPTDGSSPYVSGSNVTVLGNTNSMTKTDCVFNGWNTSPDGTGIHYDVGDEIASISENITLYAEWVGYATSWEWWNSGQKNDGTTFTYLTDKNYLCSFKSSANKAVASWDITGDIVYRGVKLKTKDHSMAFWVPSGKRVSITFGYMSTKPTFTVGGVNKAGDLTTSTTDSATVTYTTTADTKFYIENETTTGTAFTIKSIKIEDDATCPSAYSFHYGPAVGDWETPICFEKVGSTHEWNITNFTIPDHTNGQFYVGYAGSTNGQSATKAWTDSYSESDGVGNGAMLLLPTNGSVVGNAVGATGTLVIWNNSSSKNQYVGFKPDGYSIRYSGTDHVFTETATPNKWETDVVTLPDVSSTNYTMEIKTAGGYTTCYHSNAAEAISNMGVTEMDGGKKKIYLDAGVWRTDEGAGEKIAIWDFTTIAGSPRNCWGANDNSFMTYNSTLELYEGYVLGDATNIILVRIDKEAETPSWDKKWNQTDDITLSTLNNKFSITGWHIDDDDKKNSSYTVTSMHPTTGQKGKFRMWANSASTNWYVHWIPYYVLSYNENGGSGTTTATERNSESSTPTVTVASNGFTAPEGYEFAGWATSDERADARTVDYAAGASYTLTSNATLYAVWRPKNYSITYKDQGDVAFSGTHETGYPTSHTYGSATALKKATKDNYAFAGWYTSSSCTGDAVTSLGATDYDDDIILYARWVELDLHEPGVYEAPTSEGGYGRVLKHATVNAEEHDYEVYLFTIENSNGSIYAGPKTSISDGKAMFTEVATNTEAQPSDTWFSFRANTYEGDEATVGVGEFSQLTSTTAIGDSRYAVFKASSYLRLRVSGYSEFAFIGRDNTVGSKEFVVRIDGKTQSYTHSATDKTAFRFELDPDKEHFIELTTSTDNSNRFRGFSLRLPDVTRYTVSATNTDGYGSVDVTSISNVRSGSTIYTSSNTLTVGGTTVTATENSSTAQYSYAFNNWTKGDGTSLPGTVTGAITVRANFTRTLNSYTVTWKNGATTLETDASVNYGATPSYDGSTPTKAADALYTYTFSGWSPAIGTVTGDATYSAQFTATPKTVAYGDATIYAYNDSKRVVSGTRKTAMETALAGTDNTETGISGSLPLLHSIDGLTSVVLAGNCNSETKFSFPWLGSYIKMKTASTTATITFNVASGYEGTATIYFSGYNKTATLTNGANSDAKTSDSKDPETEGSFTSKNIALVSGANTLTISGNNGYISRIDVTLGASAYTLTYNANAGEDVVSGLPDPENHTAGTYALSSSVPTRSGYIFDGWYENSSCTGTGYAAGDDFAISDDATLYAKWIELSGGCETLDADFYATYLDTHSNSNYVSTINKINYSFIVDEGSGYDGGWTFNEISAVDDANYFYVTGHIREVVLTFAEIGASNADASNGSKGISYIFGNHGGLDFESADFTDQGNLSATTLTLRPASDCDEFAFKPWNTSLKISSICVYYESTALSVTYDGNENTGGSEPEDNTAYTSGATVTVKGNTGNLTKTGSIFRGWTDGTTFYREGDEFVITSDVTLTAVWDGGEECETISQGTQNAEHTAITATVGSISTTGGEASDDYIKLSGDDASKYYFTITAKDGKAPIAEGDKLTVTVYNKDNTAKNIGFKIKGTAHIASVTSKTTADVVYILRSSDIEGNGTIILSRNASNDRYHAILLERCSKSSFTVSFADGNTAPDSHTTWPDDIEGIPSGSKILKPATDPTAAGYTFGGWYSDAACETAINWSTMTITADKTIYAKWTALPASTTPTLPSLSNTEACAVGGFDTWNATPTNASTISAAGESVSYSWKNSSDVEVATTATYKPAAAGTYTVTVTVSKDGQRDASVTSDELTATLNTAASKTAEPTATIAAIEGESFTISGLTASNATGYQWYSCNSTGGDKSELSGKTSATLTDTKEDDGTYYYICTIGNACGDDIDSRVVTVNVYDKCATFTSATSSQDETAAGTTKTISTESGGYAATLSGATMTFKGTTTAVGCNKTHGLVFDANDDVLTVTLTGGSLQAGTIIELGGKTVNTNNKTFLFMVGSNAATPTYTTTEAANQAFTQRYVVEAGDGICGTNSFTITKSSSMTGSKEYLNKLIVANCALCTLISPTLTYSTSTLYVDPAPTTATPTLTGYYGSPTITYASSNTDVATVNETTGEVTAVAPGTATITATIGETTVSTTDYCGAVAEAEITVAGCGVQEIAGVTLTAKDAGTPSGTLIASTSGYGVNTQEWGDQSSNDGCGTGGKIGSGTYYVFLTLSSGNYFHNGDVVKLDLAKVSDVGDNNLHIYVGTTEVGTEIGTKDSPVCDVNEIVLTNVPENTSSITLHRNDGNATIKQNPYVKSMKVYREICSDGLAKFTGAEDSDWDKTANWTGGKVASATDRVLVLKPATVNIGHAVAKEVILDQNSGNTGTLTIQANKGLEVTGTITRTEDGTALLATRETDLVLESSTAGNASLIFKNDNSSQATVQMYAKGSIDGATWNWQYVGTPFAGSIPQYNYYGSWMYKWNNGWEVVHGTDELNPFVGYCLTQQSPTTHVMGGTLVATDGNDQSVTMGVSTDMVLANSWTAPIYIGGFTAETFTSAPATIYLFNTGMAENGSEEYVSGDEAGTYVTVPVNAAEYTGNELIAPMQGFFVTTATDRGSAGIITMKYDELVRPSDSRGIIAGAMKAPKQERAEEKPEVMKIWAEGSVYSDRVVILARQDFSTGFDNGWDGTKISFGEASPSVYVINEKGDPDAVSAVSEYEGTVVGFRAGADNNYIMHFEYNGDETWYLNDLREQKSVRIDAAQTYSFASASGDAVARFIISKTPIALTPTGTGDIGDSQTEHARKVIIDDHVYIIRNGKMYNATGSLVK